MEGEGRIRRESAQQADEQHDLLFGGDRPGAGEGVECAEGERTEHVDGQRGPGKSGAEQTAYDAVTQLNQIKLLYDRTDPLESGPPSYVVELSHRYFFPAELLALLHGNGFQVLHRFGDFEGGSLDAQCESQVLVCGLT